MPDPRVLPAGWLLSRLVRACVAHPVLTVVLSLALGAVGTVYTVRGLTFQASALKLLPADHRYARLFTEYLRDFGALNYVVVAVQAPGVDEAKTYAARLVDELQRAGRPLPRVTYRIDPKQFEDRALLYLSTQKLGELADRIQDHQEFIRGYASAPSLARLLDALAREIAVAFVSHLTDLGGEERRSVDIKFLRTLLGGMADRTAGASVFESPWSAAFGTDEADEARAGYFLSSDKSLLFLFVEQRREEGNFTANKEVIEALRAAIARLRGEFPRIRAGVTGSPALSNDEMLTAFHDSTLATIIAFALMPVLLLATFRTVVRPALMLAALVVSLAWSLGLITAAVGHLSIFSVMFISLMIGVGIDYGIYFLFRYQEEIAAGLPLPEAMDRTATRTGPGILLGALSAAATFFVLGFTEFPGIQEFGVISGLAILMSCLAMLTLFPALLVLADGRRGSRPAAARLASERLPILERVAARPGLVLTSAALLTVLAAWSLPAVTFDYNLLGLQAEGTESVVWEKRIRTAGRAGSAALSTAGSLEDLRRKHEAFAGLGSVARVDSLLRLIPEGQGKKRELFRELDALIRPIRLGAAPRVNVPEIRAALETLGRRLDIAIGEAGDRGPGAGILAARAQLGTVLERLERGDPRTLAAALGDLQARLRADFELKLDRFRRNLAAEPITEQDVPEDLRSRFIGRSGRYLLRISPAVDTWERDGARQFVAQLRTVDPDVTGAPVISYEALRLMERAYMQGTLYAFLLVAALAAVLLRRASDTLLALSPLALATLWTIGLMHVLGVRFNLANVWGLPLIIGTGAEYGLNMVLRYREALSYGGPIVGRSTALAVTLNGLTTIGGFGSLLVARHQGIWSLGLLLTVGAIACLAAALVVLPALLRRVAPAGAPDVTLSPAPEP